MLICLIKQIYRNSLNWIQFIPMQPQPKTNKSKRRAYAIWLAENALKTPQQPQPLTADTALYILVFPRDTTAITGGIRTEVHVPFVTGPVYTTTHYFNTAKEATNKLLETNHRLGPENMVTQYWVNGAKKSINDPL